jgi:hypothetical protein
MGSLEVTLDGLSKSLGSSTCQDLPRHPMVEVADIHTSTSTATMTSPPHPTFLQYITTSRGIQDMGARPPTILLTSPFIGEFDCICQRSSPTLDNRISHQRDRRPPRKCRIARAESISSSTCGRTPFRTDSATKMDPVGMTYARSLLHCEAFSFVSLKSNNDFR